MTRTVKILGEALLLTLILGGVAVFGYRQLAATAAPAVVHLVRIDCRLVGHEGRERTVMARIEVETHEGRSSEEIMTKALTHFKKYNIGMLLDPSALSPNPGELVVEIRVNSITDLGEEVR